MADFDPDYHIEQAVEYAQRAGHIVRPAHEVTTVASTAAIALAGLATAHATIAQALAANIDLDRRWPEHGH